MAQFDLPLSQPPIPRRRGRPPGARNKRSTDLARYVEATFGGMTPGQQAAELALVRPKDLAQAKAVATELGIYREGLPPMMLAMAIKARQLASAIGCETKEAWLLLQRERAELMAYVHQKQPQAAETKPGQQAQVFVITDGDAQQLADFSQGEDDERIEFIEHSPAPAEQVGQMKSDDQT